MVAFIKLSSLGNDTVISTRVKKEVLWPVYCGARVASLLFSRFFYRY